MVHVTLLQRRLTVFHDVVATLQTRTAVCGSAERVELVAGGASRSRPGGRNRRRYRGGVAASGVGVTGISVGLMGITHTVLYAMDSCARFTREICWKDVNCEKTLKETYTLVSIFARNTTSSVNTPPITIHETMRCALSLLLFSR